MKKRISLLSVKTKLITENIVGLVLGLSIGFFVIPSSFEDVCFYFFKKSAEAEVISIVNGGTSENPLIVKVKYIDEYQTTDFIFVDSIFAKKLIPGGKEEIFYLNTFRKNTYFANYQFPRFGSMLVGFLCCLILMFSVYSFTKNILKLRKDGNV